MRKIPVDDGVFVFQQDLEFSGIGLCSLEIYPYDVLGPRKTHQLLPLRHVRLI